MWEAYVLTAEWEIVLAFALVFDCADLLELLQQAAEEENTTGDGGFEGGHVGEDAEDERGRQVGRGGQSGPQSCSEVEDVGWRVVDVRDACWGEAGPSRANAPQAGMCKHGKSFKKFVNTCYGPQPAARHPQLPTGYNPLRCYLLDGLRRRLSEEEQAINDDREVTGCTFITDGTTDICGRSLVNYILVGRLKPLFIKCEDVSDQDKDAVAVIRGWINFFREIGVEKITTIYTDSFSGNKSAATMLRADPEFQQIYWIPCTAHCMDLFMQDVGGKPWAKDAIKKANMVVKFFRNHRWPRSALRTELMAQKGVKVRVLLRPSLTMFGTHFVMTCERALHRLVLGDSWTNMDWQPYIKKNAYEVESLITDRAFWADLKKLHEVMKGPYDVPRMVDKDIHCLSRVYDAAVDPKNCVLHAPLTDGERDNILHDVGKRTDMLLNPVHVVTRLLDPRLRDITVFNNLDLMAQFDSMVSSSSRGSMRTPQQDEEEQQQQEEKQQQRGG
ncbi:hypothetical protein CBR_g12142 [Chara braunii]|uniref:DUF659 domain-containing protein n=1 Tax=Chara braunii TaxID=69332 RepID=A0A388KR77_CHABU|nr:hypothetical protein CBR_g12142 [Chara braunii]|eukprot:GBG72571.1 hypothetical protein CBR_g12142 [Chara braunii]